MAAINRTDVRKSGQLFILGALLLAILLTSLAFTLNLTIYSENTAARGSGVSEDRALEHSQTVEIQLQDSIDHLNKQKYTSTTNVSNSATPILDTIKYAETRRQEKQRAVVDLTTTYRTGIIAAQDDETRSFTSVGGNGSWTLFSSPQNYSALRQNVDPANTLEISESDRDSNSLSSLTVFYTEFEDSGGNIYEVYLYKLSSETKLTLTVVDPSGNTQHCKAPTGDYVEVDYIKSTFGETHCSPLSFIDETNAWEIRYNNGSNTIGEYAIVANTTGTGFSSGNFESDPSTGNNPYYYYGVYDIQYTTNYKDSKYNYRSEIVVLPEDLSHIIAA